MAVTWLTELTGSRLLQDSFVSLWQLTLMNGKQEPARRRLESTATDLDRATIGSSYAALANSMVCMIFKLAIGRESIVR
jgi:hypothetical protein